MYSALLNTLIVTIYLFVFIYLKIEKDGNVSILKIRDVSSRDTGEIRCIASVSGKGPSISCTAKLRLRYSLYDDLDDSVSSLKDIQLPEKAAELKYRRRCEESPTRIRSSSFPRRTASCTKHVSPLPARKRISNNAPISIPKSQFGNDLSAQKVTEKYLDSNVEFSNDLSLLLSNEEATTNISTRLLSPRKEEHIDQHNTTVIPNEEQKHTESCLKELIKATILKEPTDVTVFRGNRVALKVTYQGFPEPTVKWLQVVSLFSFLLSVLISLRKSNERYIYFQ